jgi:hypothetical protein
MDVRLTTSERIARLRARAGRGLAYWRGSLAILAAGAIATGVVAEKLQPVYRAECTVFARARIRTDDREESGSSSERAVRRSARLKDMLTTRGRLEAAVRRFGLYPEIVAGNSMLEAVEEMKPHVGFRAIEGGLYVVSFDGHPADTVRDVTAYLSDSLIEDYAAGDLDDLRREGDFLATEERSSLDALEAATRELTAFLAAHPEFAVEATQGPSFVPGAEMGAPVAPRATRPPAQDAATTADAELAALYREHARLDGQARGGAPARAGGPLAQARGLDEPIAEAQGLVEIAAKRVAETQADLASKSNLTEDHPDMRAARMAADGAARQLHEAKLAHDDLLQAKAGSGATGGAPPGLGSTPPGPAEKLRQIDAQIAQRRGQLARSRDAAGARPPSPEVAAVVELEADWQRLLRSTGEARARHDDLELRAERSKLALAAARAKENEQMAVIEPAVRPTHPARGGRTQVALAGLATALLFAVAYAVARAAADDRLFDADDVEALGLLPVLCVVPRLAPRADRSGRGARAAV